MRRAILAAGLALATPALAQQAAPPTAQVDPARLAAARRLIDQMQVDATLDRMFVQLSPVFATSVIGAMAQDAQTRATIEAINARPNGKEQMTAILSQEFMTAIKKRYHAIKEATAREYAAAFTTEELTAISAFYASGPGAKALRLLPELQQKLGATGQQLGRTAGMEAGQRGFERIAREVLGQTEKPRT